MNRQPIENARDNDLRLSSSALRRAAERARDLARKTGTAIVVSHDGVVELLSPLPVSTASSVQEPTASYDDKK